MSFLYSLRFKANQDGATWRDVTPSLDLAALPSITVAAERGDVPLVATASDLTLTVRNGSGIWDVLLDAQRIVGTLPPINAEVLRAPAAHFGTVLLCRKSSSLSVWQVVFFGFVDPNSPQFNRTERTCTFTAYAPGKLLEAGNAERVQRFYSFVPARPFVVSTDSITFKGGITHPEPPSGNATDADGNPIDPANDWWAIFKGALDPAIPLLAGDQVRIVRSVPVGTWTEGMALTPIVDDVFHVVAVVANGDHLFFQTKEAPDDAQLVIAGALTAGLELLTPWYRSRDWKALIDGSDGNTNCLKAEVNAALAILGVSDVIDFLIPAAPDLPLLPQTSQLFAQPIYQIDAVPGCTGVCYGRYSGTPFLAHQRGGLAAAVSSPITAKPDILAADSVASPFNVFPRCASNVFSPSPTLTGPDVDKSVRLLSSSINDQLDSTAPPDFATDDLPVAGQDIHTFSEPEIAASKFFDSTHWCRTPSSYRSGTEPKRYYRIYAKGRYISSVVGFRKRIFIDRLTTGDEGATWTTEASGGGITADYVDDSTASPNEGRSCRPSIKVFQLGVGAFLYVWVDPMKSTAACKESATDDVTGSALVAETPFIAGGADGSPVLSSSAVHWPDGTTSGTTLFFADRADRTGVDVYYYAPGPTWALATIVDNSGLGLPAALVGADFINAVTDTSRSPVRLYVMNGKTLYAMHVAFSAGTLTISAAQAIPIDQVNYDAITESTATTATNPNAVAWLACPVTQNNAGEPDYTGASDALIVGTSGAVYIVSNAASNIVDVADFEGLSVGAALAKLIILRAYFMLTGADLNFTPDPTTYTPSPLVTFYARLETAARKGVIDLVAATEDVQAGTWLQNYQSVQVGNSKLDVGPIGSSTTLTNLDGATFTISAPRNAQSAALSIDSPFLTTVSFAQLLANLFAQEFVIPRPSATLMLRDPYSRGSSVILLPGLLILYLLTPPSSTQTAATQQGRVLTIDYPLDTALLTVGVA